jgi:AsmA protein
MKWILRLLGLLGVLVLLVVIVGVYLAVTFDPNAYKDRIEGKVAELTGRELTLAGSIELTLFPSVGLRLEDVRLANPEGFTQRRFAEVRVVDVAVAALPLLRGEIEVQRIDADGIGIYLARNVDGRSNWDDLAERAERARSGALGETGNTGPGGAPGRRVAFDDIEIAGLNLTDVRLEWDDRQHGMRMILAPVNLAIRGFRPGLETPLKLDGSWRVEPDDAEPMELDLELDALLTVDLAANRYSLRRVHSSVDLRHPVLEPQVSARVDADLVLDLRDDVARVERISVHVSDLHLTGLFEVRGLGGEQPALQGELRSNTFNPRALLAALGLDAPETTDPDVLQRMAVDLSLSGGIDRLAVNPLLVSFDDSSLRGEAGLDLSGPRPMVRFALRGDRLDLDRYLPPEIEQARVIEGVPEAPDAPDAPEAPGAEDIPVNLPVGLMRSLDIDGSLRLDALTLLGLTLQNIEMKLRANDGEWRMEPLSGTGYEGRLESRLTLDARRDVPRFAGRVQLEDVAIGALLEALRQEESRLLGTGNLALEIDTSGASVNALTSALNGTGNMRFRDGAVRGINVARIIRQADARLRGERLEDDGEPNQTDFTELSGSFRIENGVVHNDDLVAHSPLLRVSGRGSADLPAQQLDYRVDTTLVASIEGQGGRSLDDLRGVNLPIRITGPFTGPRFRLDLDDVVRERIDERVRRETDRLQQRLLERLGGTDSGATGDADAQEEAPASEPSGSGSLEKELDRLRERGRSLFR